MTWEETCKTWHKLCTKFTCLPAGSTPYPHAGECLKVAEKEGPYVYEHNIDTDYSLTVCKTTLPVVKTTRRWKTSITKIYAVPQKIESVAFLDNQTWWCIDGYTTASNSFTASEDCRIDKATVHYLDLENNVCLYRLNKEKIVFNQTTTHENRFKNPYNYEFHPSIRLYGGENQTWDSVSTEEWHLVIDGSDSLIATCEYDPIPELRQFAIDGSDDLFDKNYPKTADKNLELILHIGEGVGSSQAIPWDDELRYHGFYSYRGIDSPYLMDDGGCRDYYYPAWCRMLQEDPFWKKVAADRAYYMHGGGVGTDNKPFTSSNYAPSADVAVDPLPRGTFVRHPLIGNIYQFLVEKRNGTHALVSSPELQSLISQSLAASGVASGGTMLHYPIGV